MKTISTTQARQNIKTVFELVTETGEVFVVNNHKKPEVLIVKYPKNYNKKISEICNFNAYSNSFDFLKDEPDIYSVDDLREVYV